MHNIAARNELIDRKGREMNGHFMLKHFGAVLQLADKEADYRRKTHRRKTGRNLVFYNLMLLRDDYCCYCCCGYGHVHHDSYHDDHHHGYGQSDAHLHG